MRRLVAVLFYVLRAVAVAAVRLVAALVARAYVDGKLRLQLVAAKERLVFAVWAFLVAAADLVPQPVPCVPWLARKLLLSYPLLA